MESSTRKETPVKSSTPSSSTVKDKETKIRHLQLYRAALDDDWKMAEEILKDHPDDKATTITRDNSTVLHIAVAAASTMFVKSLVDMMNKDDLAKTNIYGNTAFCHAAVSGKLELAKAMMNKNKDLAKIRGGNQMLPIYMAALFGHQEMVKHLYEVSEDVLNDNDHIDLLITLISTGLFDVALNLVKKHPELATARGGSQETASHALARLPVISSNFNSQNQQGVSRGCFNLFASVQDYGGSIILSTKVGSTKLAASGTNKSHNKKLPPKALELIKFLWKQVILLDDSEISELIGSPWRLMHHAAKQGNIEFLKALIREYPDSILEVDENRYTIFHFAVMYRHNDIFKLIHEIGTIKDLIAPYEDNQGNNILHLAGMSAPPDRLNIVSGAALQLQRELIWLEEVRKIVQPLDAEGENENNKTPRALFTENHAELKEKGEKWMKDTANNCMIVATLITTVVFAAAFTVPGGTKEETGTPHFVKKVSFIIFVISDAISLVLSSCSILNFLSILTSRYAEEDFVLVLPTKLFVGLATLLLSIAAMMVVFCATIFIVLKDGVLWLPILVTTIAFVPVILFFKQQRHLLSDALRSTYMNNSLFQPTNRTIFYSKRQEIETKKRK